MTVPDPAMAALPDLRRHRRARVFGEADAPPATATAPGSAVAARPNVRPSTATGDARLATAPGAWP